MPFATRRYIRRRDKRKRTAPRPKRPRARKKKKRKKGILQILTDLYHSRAPKKGVVPYRFKPLKLDRAPRPPGRRWQGPPVQAVPRQDGGYRNFAGYPWRYNNPPGQEIYDHLH